jgi:hypothetical protein
MDNTIIDEELVIEAGQYPQEWDMEAFKKLPSFAKRVKYAQEKLGKLGTGSARIVFSVDENTVMKLAKNPKGLAQNSVEIDIGTKDWYDCVVKVFDFDSDNLWLEAEKAKRVTKPEFKKIVGYNFDTWTTVLYFKIKQIKDGVGYYILNEPLAKEIMEGEYFNEIVEMSANWDIEPGDFRRISSWGMVNRGGAPVLVIIDVGLTNQVYKDYYYQGPRF